MSLAALNNVTFGPDQIIPLNTVGPDSDYVLGGPISVGDPGFPPSEADLEIPDTFTVMDLNLSNATSYRLATAMIQDTGPGGPVGAPFEADILGVNSDSVIFGFNPDGTPVNPNPGPGQSYYEEYGIVSLSSVDHPVFPLTFVFNSAVYQPTAPCFARGTRIDTRRGEVPVEDIAVGDEVRTMSGAFRPVVWAGHRAVDLAQHNHPELARPVRISAGALADNVPSRDLVVSPDHNLFLQGVLIPAKCLLNGSTVATLDVARVFYHHIELETHDVVFAEGAATETYLDTGNRTSFAGLAVTDAHPDFSSAPDVNYFAWDAKGCARLVIAGPEVENARAMIDARAVTNRDAATETLLVA